MSRKVPFVSKKRGRESPTCGQYVGWLRRRMRLDPRPMDIVALLTTA
jgi:hypothetical protein